jgi:hypothetical protein
LERVIVRLLRNGEIPDFGVSDSSLVKVGCLVYERNYSPTLILFLRMVTSVNSLARLFTVMAIVGSVLFACSKSDVSPADSASSARTSVSADSTTRKDTLCHKGDSTRPHRKHDHPDSLHHHMDSLHVKPPHPDSVAHDSTHRHKHGRGKGH